LRAATRHQRSHSRRCASSFLSRSARSFRAAFCASSFRRAISFLSSLTAAADVDRPGPGRLESAIKTPVPALYGLGHRRMRKPEHSAVEPSSFSVILRGRGVDTRSKAAEPPNITDADDRCRAAPSRQLRQCAPGNSREPGCRTLRLAPPARTGRPAQHGSRLRTPTSRQQSSDTRTAVRVTTECDARSLAHLSG